jgi:RHS repeat-associated protein
MATRQRYNDYINGEGFCCTDKSSKMTALDSNIGNGNDDPEKLIFFYHSDHLGSTSYVTNLDGNVVQHVEYIPFGEVFLEERNNIWNTPYLFNSKELDEETGLYYYGARYYNPRESVWLSVDKPLIDGTYMSGIHNGGVYNSFNLNGYAYCYQNPVLLVDPDGNQTVAPNIKGNYYQVFIMGGAQLDPTGRTEYGKISNTTTWIQHGVRNGNVTIFAQNWNYWLSDKGKKDVINLYVNHLAEKHNSGDKLILYGYSRGAVAITDIMRGLAEKGIPIELMVLVDMANGPKSGEVNNHINGNVKKVINFYQTSEEYSSLTSHGQKVIGNEKNQTSVTNIDDTGKHFFFPGNQTSEDVNHSNIDEFRREDVVNLINQKTQSK